MSNVSFVFRTVVLSLAGSVLVFLGVGQLLADEWTVSTTRVVPAQLSQVAGPVVDMSQWEQWCDLNPPLGNPTTREVRGDPGEAGQQIVWSGPLGRAVITLDAVTPEGVEYRLEFGVGTGAAEGSFRAGGKLTGSIRWVAQDDGIAVTWSEHGDLPTLIERWSKWFGALQEKVRQIQRASLSSLEEHVLSHRAAAPAEPDGDTDK